MAGRSVPQAEPQETVGRIVRWLIGGAPPAGRPQDVLATLCERLAACGPPLHRVAVFVRTLHPNVMGQRFLWRQEQEVEVSERPYWFLDDGSYLASPIALPLPPKQDLLTVGLP